MQFYTFDETTYPGIPEHVGPESKLTNRFCDPALAAQTYHEHLDEWALCEGSGLTAPWSTSTTLLTSISIPRVLSWRLPLSCGRSA